MYKIKQLLASIRSKPLRYLALTLFLVFFCWFWFRGKEIETIKEHQFLVAIDTRWFPLDLHGQETYMQGFISELTASVAKLEEIKIHLLQVPTSELFENMNKGYYDAVYSSLSPNVLNESKYRFSEPVYYVGPVLIVPLGSHATSIAELHSVGVKTGFSGIFGRAGIPLTSILIYDDMNLALSDLVLGKIDGLIMGSVDAYAYIQGYYSDKLKVVTAPLTHEGIRLVAKNNFLGKGLINLFDKGLKEIKEEGVYEKELQKWELINPEKAYLPM